MGLEGASRPGHSLLTHEMGGWTTCDFTGFFNIIPVISGRWEEDKYKAVWNGTATGLVRILHVPSEGKVASIYVLGGGGSGW